MTQSVWRVWMVYASTDQRLTDAYLATAMLSTFFVVVPTVVNIMFAVTMADTVKTRCPHNAKAQMFIREKSKIFIGLTFVTASVFSVLTLLNSRAFGLGIFNGGLTDVEMRYFMPMRFKSTVMLETGPQFCIQIFLIIAMRSSSEPLPTFVIFSFATTIASICIIALEQITQSRNPIQGWFYFWKPALTQYYSL